MTFMDSINEILDIKLLGVPVVFILAFLVLIIWFVWNYKPRRGRKRLNLEKEIRKDMDSLYKVFYSPVNKNMSYGFQRIGYVLGEFPMFWDITTDWRTQLKRLKHSREKNMIKMKIAKAEKEKKNIIELTILKYTKPDLLNKGLGKLGLRYNYMVVPTEAIDSNAKELNLKTTLAKDYYLGVTYLSKASRGFIENIAYKLSRKEELTEFADYIPKQNYLEMETAKKTAKMREQARIESEKYKGQIEGAEDS